MSSDELRTVLFLYSLAKNSRFEIFDKEIQQRTLICIQKARWNAVVGVVRSQADDVNLIPSIENWRPHRETLFGDQLS